MKTNMRLSLLIIILISLCLDSKAQYYKSNNTSTKEVKYETISLNGVSYTRYANVNDQFEDSFEWQQLKRQKQIQLEQKRQQVLKDYNKNNNELKYNEPNRQSLFQQANGMSLVDEIIKITNDNKAKYKSDN